MKKSLLAAGLLAAGLVVAAAEAQARCSSDYYTGFGTAKKWKQGRANARADWSNRVEDALGWPWSVWAKGKVRDERCRWNGSRNRCVSEAYPCR